MSNTMVLGALLLAAVFTSGAAQSLDPLSKGNDILGALTGILHPTTVPATPAPAPTPAATRDVNKICSNIAFPPTFGTVPAFNLSSGVFNASTIAFQPKPNYVQQTLDFNSVSPLYKAISAYALSKFNVTVTNRGEAHITVLTPPEFSVLQPFITIDQINAIAAPLVQSAQFCVLCLGKDTLPINGALNTVFNVVVRSPDLAAVRSQIFNLFVRSGGDGSRFSPVNIFAPHITMAFTASNPAFNATDLFVENGIYKWDNSCHAPINLV